MEYPTKKALKDMHNNKKWLYDHREVLNEVLNIIKGDIKWFGKNF
jgi:hypothetical protein